MTNAADWAAALSVKVVRPSPITVPHVSALQLAFFAVGQVCDD
jgi:hypothetical protein